MRRLAFSLSLLILMLSFINADNREPGWILQHTGFYQNFNDVHSYGDSLSWICGNNGHIVYTGDAGETWQLQNTGVADNLQSISFADQHNGTATGLSGVILHTSNGGSDWSIIQEGWMLSFYTTKMIDENIAFVAGVNTILAPFITYTTDGWQTMNYSHFYLEQSPGAFHEGTIYGFEYIDENTWFTAATAWQGDGVISRTQNGGSSWETVFWTYNPLNAIFFPSSSQGYAVGANGIFISTEDGGNNWTQTTVPGAGNLNDVYFVNETHGWVAGANGFIAMTTDGGISWQIQNSNTYSDLSGISFTDEFTGRASSEGGLTLFTTTGGTEPGLGILNGNVILDAGGGDPQNIEITIGDIIINPDEAGFWEIELSEGLYELNAELEPYDPVVISDIEILSGIVTTIDFTMYYNVIEPPVNLKVREDYHPWPPGHQFYLLWDYPDTSLEVISFEYFVECVFSGEFCLGGGTTENEIRLKTEYLSIGTLYLIGVSTIYQEGESEYATILFFYHLSTEEASPLLETTLYRNSPNPFNPDTRIKFDIANKGLVKLDVYNSRGQLVKNLLNEHVLPGTYEVLWEGKDNSGKALPSGLYFYRLSAEDFIKSKKMLLLK